jgi:hypothetical protein
MTDAAFLTHAGTLLIGVGTGIVIHAKLWWGAKTKAERVSMVNYAIDSLEDGRLTVEEAKGFIKQYL